MQTFSFSPPKNLIEEGKWLLAVASFECTISVSRTTNENNSFSITIQGHWDSKSTEKIIDDINKFLELRSFELHVQEVRKRGKKIKIRDNEKILSDFDTQKNEILEELKNIRFNEFRGLQFYFQYNRRKY